MVGAMVGVCNGARTIAIRNAFNPEAWALSTASHFPSLRKR